MERHPRVENPTEKVVVKDRSCFGWDILECCFSEEPKCTHERERERESFLTSPEFFTIPT